MADQSGINSRVDKKSVLFVFTLSSFLTPFMGASTNIALPSIGKEFSMNAVLLGWVASSYLLTASIFLVPFGKIADMYGRKKIFLWGISIYCGGCLLCGIAWSSASLLAFRVIQGLGGSMIFGTGVAILTSVFPAGERGRAMGIAVSAVYLGLSCGPIFGGLLTQHLGWRSIFLINLPLVFIIIAIILWKIKGDWTGAKGDRFDAVGSAIYSVMLFCLMYGFSRLPSKLGFGLIAIGAIGAAAFYKWEITTEHPVLEMDLFRKNAVFAFSNLAALINYSATSAVGFLLSLYLQYVKGMSPQSAGLVLVSQPIVMAVFSPQAGKLSDRIEPRIVASAGMALDVIGLALFCFLSEGSGLVFIIVGQMILGLGFALFSSPNTNAVMSSVQKEYLGVASSTLGTMRLTGQMFSMGIAMLVFSLYLGDLHITPETHGRFLAGARTMFIVFMILCCCGVGFSLIRGRIHRKMD